MKYMYKILKFTDNYLVYPFDLHFNVFFFFPYIDYFFIYIFLKTSMIQTKKYNFILL